MIKRILNFLKPAFEGEDKKASSSKLTSFWFVVLVTILHIWWLHKAMKSGNFELLPEILYSDSATILTLQGFKSWERIKSNKNDGLTGLNNGQN